MLRFVLGLSVLVATATLVEAKTFKLGEGAPVSEITVPDGWDSDGHDGSLEATTGGVYLSAEIIDAKDIADAGRETAQFLGEHKVKLKPDTKKQVETTVAGLPAVQTSWDGTDDDGPTHVRVSLVKVRDDKLTLLIYWRSDAGEAAHGAEVEAIFKSLAKVK